MLDMPIHCKLRVLHTDFIMQNHRVHGVSLLPGITFVDIIVRILTAREIDISQILIRDIVFPEPVATSEGFDNEVVVKIGVEVDGIRDITAASRPTRGTKVVGDWRQNLSAKLMRTEVPASSPMDIQGLKAEAQSIRNVTELYALCGAVDSSTLAAEAC
jgi:hypothetical protein